MHGCNGHMGQVISGLVAQDPDAEIVAGIDVADQGKNSYPVYTDMKECQVEADALIDFSSAKATDALLDYCAERKLPVVLCTTGLSEEQLHFYSSILQRFPDFFAKLQKIAFLETEFLQGIQFLFLFLPVLFFIKQLKVFCQFLSFSKQCKNGSTHHKDQKKSHKKADIFLIFSIRCQMKDRCKKNIKNRQIPDPLIQLFFHFLSYSPLSSGHKHQKCQHAENLGSKQKLQQPGTPFSHCAERPYDPFI